MNVVEVTRRLSETVLIYPKTKVDQKRSFLAEDWFIVFKSKSLYFQSGQFSFFSISTPPISEFCPHERVSLLRVENLSTKVNYRHQTK